MLANGQSGRRKCVTNRAILITLQEACQHVFNCIGLLLLDIPAYLLAFSLAPYAGPRNSMIDHVFLLRDGIPLKAFDASYLHSGQ